MNKIIKIMLIIILTPSVLGIFIAILNLVIVGIARGIDFKNDRKRQKSLDKEINE